MNKTQRLILAVIVPFVVLSIAQQIMGELYTSGFGGPPPSWFDEQVWWVWAIAFAVIGVFEYFLFRDGRKG